MKPLKYITMFLFAAGILLCGSSVQAQSSIANVYPNGTNMFQPSSILSFTASSPAGVTNVTVTLTVTSLYTGQSFLKNLTDANGLTITGPTTGLSISATLNSNTLYSAVIQVKDANGNMASQTVVFDTITPSYTWEAEDFDYGGGMSIDNPQVNQYANLAGVFGVDYNNGNLGNGTASYRPKGLETENPNSGDAPLRLQYIGTTNFDYNVGWTSGGDWGNYTRHFPAGVYNLFVRASGGGGAKTESGDISVVGGTATISGSAPYKFGVQGRGWGSYDFMPVTDSSGNLIQITFDGSASTLQELQNQGSDNMNFFMLMPLNTNVVASTVTVTNVSPDGSALFNPAGTFSFNAYSPTAPVDANNINVLVTATNLWGQGSVSSLTVLSGLTITGSSTNLNVSFPTTTNTVYAVFIQITDVNGTALSSTVSFDTIIPTYTFEAEDYNHDGGQYIDNPQTNAYYQLGNVEGIDFSCLNNVHSYAYRGGPLSGFGLNTETLNEKQRPQYNGTGYQDYDVGFNNGGNWGNYTRNYPAGTYNIYVRASDGGNSTTDSGSMALVTSDPTTGNQATTKLGTFSVPTTGAWGTYTWVPVLDASGNLVQFHGGSLQTLRATTDNGNYNVNFYLLTPADPNVHPLPSVSNFQPDGSSMFQFTNQLSFVANSSAGITTGNVQLNLNGANVSGLIFSGSSTAWNVSYPVKPNGYYTAIVTLTDANGTIKSTNTFGTFSSTNYQWEAEDYDYSGGLFFDNPQVGSYATLPGKSGTDLLESDVNGPGRGNSYRPAGYLNFPDTAANDQPRIQFTSVGATDYSIGSFGPGSWANYTRHYPPGTYNVIGRFAEGAGNTAATLSALTGGYGTPTQTTNFLGTFFIPLGGWSSWEWVSLVDGSGNPVKVTLDGSRQTLQLGGSLASADPEANVNFFMLVAVTPSPKLIAMISGGNITISFPTQTGYSYQLQYKNHLNDASWISLGGSISGNDAIQAVSDSATIGSRFYRVQVQ